MDFGLATLGGSLLSGLMGNQSADRQSDISQEQYDQTRNDLAPYRAAGVNALGEYQDQIGNYNRELPQYNSLGSFQFNPEEDAGYLAARQSGLDATTRQQNQMGNQNSGNILAALNQKGMEFGYNNYDRTFNRQLSEYGTNFDNNLRDFGVASGQEQDLYGRNQNYLSQLGGLANSGQNAANFTGQMGGQNAMNQMGANQFGASSINNAIQGGMSNYLLNDYLGSGGSAGTVNDYNNATSGGFG